MAWVKVGDDRMLQGRLSKTKPSSPIMAAEWAVSQSSSGVDISLRMDINGFMGRGRQAAWWAACDDVVASSKISGLNTFNGGLGYWMWMEDHQSKQQMRVGFSARYGKWRESFRYSRREIPQPGNTDASQ